MRSCLFTTVHPFIFAKGLFYLIADFSFYLTDVRSSFSVLSVIFVLSCGLFSLMHWDFHALKWLNLYSYNYTPRSITLHIWPYSCVLYLYSYNYIPRPITLHRYRYNYTVRIYPYKCIVRLYSYNYIPRPMSLHLFTCNYILKTIFDIYILTPTRL